MEFFWQNFLPQSVIFSLGNLAIYWYGIIIVLAILAGGWYVLKSAKNRPEVKAEQIDSLFFYLIIFGLIGARIYHAIFFNWNYFSQNILSIVKIWQGGLSIMGTILAGVITVYIWSRQHKFNFWQIADWLAPGLILGQAIGRWGNYFNQELFGLPTTGWWGIPIAAVNRVPGFTEFSHFHPTFFYESVLDIILFIILLKLISAKGGSAFGGKNKTGLVTLVYLGGYALIRFSLEFIRIDTAPEVLGMRLPQLVSLLAIPVVIWFIYKKQKNAKDGH